MIRSCFLSLLVRLSNLLFYFSTPHMPLTFAKNKPWDLGYWKKNWSDCLVEHKIIPDVIEKKPPNWLEAAYVIYSVSYGNYLSQFYIDDPPNFFKWRYENETELFTAILTGPDAPVHFDPYEREWQHWVVGNIPGNSHKKGDVLTEYEAPGECYGKGHPLVVFTPYYTSHHRYVFVIFKQPSNRKIKFDEPKIFKGNKDESARAKFSTMGFARKYGLGDPWAANFFITDLDNLFSEDNL